jgi:hypothetical protein
MAAAIAALAALPVSGQGGRAPAPDLVITAYNGGPAPANWTAPKTPWGEPDLQGVWSSDDTSGIPVSRPQAIGERLYQTDEEWAARQQQIEAGIQRAENATSTFRNDFADRAFRQTSQIVDPPDGRMPPATAEARTRAAPRDRGTFGDGPFHTTEDFTLYDRCITRGIYGSVARVIYGNGNRIIQSPGVVAISYEMIHDTRVIYTDGRPHVGNIRQYLGDSRGRWEGDTLVVETTNLTDKTSIGLNGNGLRHSSQMRMTEKIRRVADDVVQYQLTVDDPITYPRPFTISIPLTPLDGGMLLPYECHEGNQAVRNSLSAERTEDRALADDLARGIIRPRRLASEGGGGGGGGRGRGAGAGGRGGGARGGGAPADGDQER